MESDRQIILTLQKSLEAEKLRNLNLSAELDLQRNMSLGSGGANLTGKHEDRGFYSSAPGKSRRKYPDFFLGSLLFVLSFVLALQPSQFINSIVKFSEQMIILLKC